MTNTEKKKLGLDTPPRYTYQDVIDAINASDKIEEEDKKKALGEIDRLIKTKSINSLDVKLAESILGSALGALFSWTSSQLGYEFWRKIDNALNFK